MALANTLKFALKKKLGKKRLFYVCRDIERAEAGLLLGLPAFHILTNQSELAGNLRKKYSEQIRLSGQNSLLDTLDLLKDAKLTEKIDKNDLIMVFKPTVQIEALCHERGWKLINPPAAMANRVEEKMSQVEWLGPLKKYLPDTKISLLKDIRWPKKKFILQFNRTHTGSGTILINSGKVLNDLKKRFPEREARLSKFIDGPIITSNNVVWGDRVLVGNVSYQITGLKPFTDNPFATIGNDWQVVPKIISGKQLNDYRRLATAIGRRLMAGGWRGLFGIDAIIDKKTGKVHLLEINARQPASTSYESILQFEIKPDGATTFAAHLVSLLGMKTLRTELTPINDGAQIVQRVTAETPALSNPNIYRPVPFRHIRYENTKSGSDLMRVQSHYGVMDGHNVLNEHGNELSIFIRSGKTGRVFNGPRSGMIIVKNNHLLCIERNRFGYHYWVIPGGTREGGECSKKTARREIREETGLRARIDMTKKPILVDGGRHETYYWATLTPGRAKLGGPEKERNTKGNHYSLKWIKLSDIKKINLLPSDLKNILIKIFK